MTRETIHYSKPSCHWRLKPVTKIYLSPEVVSTQNRLDFCGDVSEAAGPPANFSSILLLVERLWCGPVVARRLLRWLYQSQSSLKSITHSHQRPPCTAIVTEPSGPQRTVHIYLYKLYLAPRERACLCKWVESNRVKLVKRKMVAFSTHHSSTLLYTGLQPSTDMPVLHSIICWTSLSQCGGLPPLAPTCLVSWSPACPLTGRQRSQGHWVHGGRSPLEGSRAPEHACL